MVRYYRLNRFARTLWVDVGVEAGLLSEGQGVVTGAEDEMRQSGHEAEQHERVHAEADPSRLVFLARVVRQHCRNYQRTYVVAHSYHA